MGLPIVLLLGGGAYLLWKNQQATSAPGTSGATSVAGTVGAAIGHISFALLGPNSDPSGWYQGITPGTVNVGGSPGGAAWQPAGNPMKTVQALTGGVTGLASALGAGSVAGIGSSGFAAAGTAFGTALPLIGVAVGLVTTIVGIISAHHQQALANEGRVLNSTDPNMINAMVMVLQAVLAGEITTAAQAQAYLKQIVADWYSQVKSIEKGVWHFTGQDLSADYQKVWIERTQPTAGAPGYSDYHAPDPCNAACLIGHFFAERNSYLVMVAVNDALAGNHGQLVLPDIPPHDTQSGFPAVTVTY